MQAHVDAGMLFKEFDKWQIGVFVGLFQHMAEIATRLVGMNQQDEMKAFGHGDNFARKHHTVWRNFYDS